MTSINYNYSAATALRALQASSKGLEQAQIRVATGRKVNSSSDNATLWALSKKIESDVASSQTYIDGIKTASAKGKVASAAVDSVSAILTQMKAKITAAQSADTAGKAALQVDFAALQSQLATVVKQATFDGTENWLDGSSASTSILTADGVSETITLGTTTSLISATGVTGALNKLGATVTTKSIVTLDLTADSLTGAMTDLNTAISSTNTIASSLGATLKRLDTASSFLTTLNDIKTKAVSSLIDADLDEESAKITALQTKQSLQTTILQIANQSSQNILRLFQ